MKVIEIMSDSTATIEFSTTGTVANGNVNENGKGNGSENLNIQYPDNNNNQETPSQPSLPPPAPEAVRPPERMQWPGNIDRLEDLDELPLEVIKSPEFALFGRFLVQEILRLESIINERTGGYETVYSTNEGPIKTLSDKGRYLDKLYNDLQRYVQIFAKHRNERITADEETNYLRQTEIQSSSLASQLREADREYEQERPRLQRENKTVTTLLERFKNSPQDAEAKKDLLIYVKEAQRIGLLAGADKKLTDMFLILKSGQVPSGKTPQQFIDNELNSIASIARINYIESLNRPGLTEDRLVRIRELNGIWEFYLEMAKERLNVIVEGREPAKAEEGEWDPFAAKEEERYWDNSESYPEYYNVTAVTKAQFIRAKETFLQIVKGGGLGKGPDTVFAHLENFRKVFGSRAQKIAQSHLSDVDSTFATEIRLELEGLSYLWGADYANEVYNPEQYKQFMTAMALHEGPKRWVQVARSGGGLVAAHSYKWDKDARLNLYHNPGGSRGQIANDTVTQNYLMQQIKQIMVEEGVGIVFKDPQLIKRIGTHQSDEAFKDLYDGFDNGDAHRNNYLHRSLRILSNGLITIDKTAAQLSLAELKAFYARKDIPEDLKKTIQIGKVQEALSNLRERVRQGLGQNQRIFSNIRYENLQGEELIRLKELNIITAEEIGAYEEALAKSADSFEVAFQMVGASAEKVRRGGGVFYVDRNIYIQAYEKLQYIDDKYLDENQKRSKRVGRILWALRTDGAKPDNNKKIFDVRTRRQLTDQEFYDSLSGVEKTDYVDHMPVYMTEKFVQFAENWTKMKYGDDSDIWRQEGFSQRVKDIPNFRAKYRAAMMKQARIGAADQIKRNGFQAQLQDMEYSYVFIDSELLRDYNRDRIVDPETGDPIRKIPRYLSDDEKANKKATSTSKMKIKTATGEIDPQTGKEKLDKKGKLIFKETKDKEITFEDTQNHWLSRWTSHTYWFYQQENRHMILQDYVFKEAEKIKKGELREKDANPLAVFLLIIDPSLRRVRSMTKEGRGQMEQEIEMMGAAVEESYQSHWRINRNLHRLFLPVDGDPHKMRMGYNREDYGGASRFALRCKDLMASQPRRFARRMAALIADMPMEVTSMPDIWGADGILGAIEMMGDPISGMADQGIASQFALTKFIDQMGHGWDLFQALVGKVDGREVVDVEGLNEKPTNNADQLQRWRSKGFQVNTFFEDENQFMYALKDSFGRLEKVLKVMRVLTSSVRNAQGILWLEEKDIFLPDGKYNPEHAKDRNTGSSRHSEKIFFETYIKWLTSPAPGAGVQAYPDDAPIYIWLHNILLADRHDEKKKREQKRRTIADWMFDKIGR